MARRPPSDTEPTGSEAASPSSRRRRLHTVIGRRLLRRYSLAILLVFSASTTAYIALERQLSSTEGTAEAINVSGRQRMLSQRIALYTGVLSGAETEEERQNAVAILEHDVALMAISQLALTPEGLDQDLLGMNLEAVLADLLNSPGQLNADVAIYLIMVSHGISLGQRGDPLNAFLVDSIHQQSAELLPRLNDAVSEYEAYADDLLRWLLGVERLLWISTLLILAVEARLIFLPTIRMVENAIEEAEGLRDTAQSAERSQSQFLANMSHEIRTPVTGLIGMLDMMIVDESPDEDKERAQNAHRAATSLLTILDDILDYSKLEAGRLKVERVPMSPGRVVDDAVTLLTPRAEDKGIALTSSIETAVPKLIKGDPTRFRQVLLNLVSNGIKFTQRGSVQIHLSRGRPGDGPDRLLVAVQDSGIGIAPSAVESLFDRFTQAEASTARRFGGSGLGLAISKQLVGLMGGAITVDSVLDRGSTFSFWLPVEEVQGEADLQSATLNERRVPTRQLKILLAEDVRMNQMVVKGLLTKQGHTVAIANNGAEAVDAVLQDDFDVVLMDVQMPEVDGFEATRRMRALPNGKAGLPIVALTAHVMQGERDSCLAAGMNAHAGKPIKKDELLAAIASVVA